MFTNEENKSIARIIVAGASIDGTLNSADREMLSNALLKLNLEDLLAEVGFALEHDSGDFDIFEDTKKLIETLGDRSRQLSPLIFEIMAQCISGDRYISTQEATFLSTIARRLKLSTSVAGSILKKVLESKKSKLEISGQQIDALVHPHLKELLSFCGSEELVGEINADSIEERLYQAQKELGEVKEYKHEDIQKALITLGLNGSSSIDDAKDAWMSCLAKIKPAQLTNQGPTFVAAAINKAKAINDAYLLISEVDKSMSKKTTASNNLEHLKGIKERQDSFQKVDLEKDLAKIA